MRPTKERNMVQTLDNRTELTTEEQDVIGKLLTETLAGEIRWETMQAARRLDLEHIAGPYQHMIYAADTDNDMVRMAHALQDELRIACMMLEEPRWTEPGNAGGDWMAMYNVLLEMLEGTDDENVILIHPDTLPEIEKVPGWAKPLIQHAHNNYREGDELTLELLDVLEAQIQKRRAELK
jgi:hypothetical protein